MHAPQNAQDLSQQLGWRSAIAGALLWVVFALALNPTLPGASWAELELFFAVLVLVPIGLALCVPTTWTSLRAWRVACALQPVAATTLILSWTAPPGPTAFLLALPWFALTSFAGFLGLARMRRRGLRPPGESCVDVALLSIAVGGVWTLLSRRAALPFDWHYSDMLAEAVYFQGASFLILLATGLASPRSSSTFAAWSQVSVLTGCAAVLILRCSALMGPSAMPNAWADILTTLSCLVCAGLQARGAYRVAAHGALRLLWGLSALYLLAGASHGLFKALGAAMQGGVASPSFVLEGRFVLPGFALAAVIAWNLARRVKPAELPNR